MTQNTPEKYGLIPENEEGQAARYSRLVSRIVRQFFLQGGDQDDLYQEGMIGLLKAIRSYDPARSDNFEAYASLCIRRQLYDTVRRDVRLSRREEDVLRQIAPDPVLTGVPDPETQCLANETETEIKAALHGFLSAFEASVLDPYLAGYSVSEISRSLGRSPKSVENAILRIRRKVARYLSQGENRHLSVRI
ncbi:MAG: sigma-70 family RNA polymerase sigma factor [Clostridia bacterium]|nr:sigma-70 family RNA polymerase sigma factor [Clostridia bacterium]